MKVKKCKNPVYMADAEALVDEIESAGLSAIRIRTRIRGNQKTISGGYGFDVFGLDSVSGRRGLIRTKIKLFPAVDGYSYGYIPSTDHNLSMLPNLLSSWQYAIEDPDYVDIALAGAKSQGLCLVPTVPVVKVVISEEQVKLDRLAELRRLVELQEYDREIAELEAKLSPKQVIEDKPKPLTGVKAAK